MSQSRWVNLDVLRWVSSHGRQSLLASRALCEQYERLNMCRLIYFEIFMVQGKDFLDFLGFCNYDKGSIGKIHGEVAVFRHGDNGQMRRKKPQ